jgi:dipeptidyl aminopeptidase/acylaminoacyl peptidase
MILLESVLSAVRRFLPMVPLLYAYLQIVLINILSKKQVAIAEGSMPQWSPDGTAIAYIGENSGQPAIFIYRIAGGYSEYIAPVYESDYFVDHYTSNNFSWSPDGKSIAYVSAGPDGEIRQSSVRIFNDLLFKTKGGRGRLIHSDKRSRHIWLVSVAEKNPSQVFSSDHQEHSISWSNDGNNICFISNTTGHADTNQWSDVFSVNVHTKEISRISSEKGSAFQSLWSPDGRYIAYLGTTGELSTNDSPAEDTQLFIVPSGGGNAQCLTLSLDRRVEQAAWDALSGYIYFTAGNAGNVSLYRVSPVTGKIETVIASKGKIYEYSLSAEGEKIIYIQTNTTSLPDIFMYSLTDNTSVRLTGMRDELTDKCILQPAETFWYKSFDGTDVQGWLMYPSGFNGTNNYPLVLVIHGGPHNMFGNEFEDRMQLLAANGYAVVFINPRGSSGYGQQFSSGCVKAWGEGDYEDLMQGVDYVLNNNAWIDASRLAVTGQSYGGYMTNRIITKTTRFRAAVADGSICNLISFAGTSLYHSLMESEYQGSVYDNYDALWNASPLKDVKKVRTPVLFLHGETDNEVPFTQAEEMFIAVKKTGTDTTLIQYTGEGHGWRPDLSPYNKKDLLQRMLDWFGKYV